jgi:hypothetical protein
MPWLLGYPKFKDQGAQGLPILIGTPFASRLERNVITSMESGVSR